MNRRERHIRIIENFGRETARHHEQMMRASLGLRAFTDEAIEEWASRLVRGHRFTQRLNRENRARFEAARSIGKA